MRRFFVLFLMIVLPSASLAHPAPDGFADLVERLAPAVVNISTAERLDVGEGLGDLREGSPLEDFYSALGNSPRIANSLGSGFIIDASGIVVTNNHVISNAESGAIADEIEVALPDGRVFAAVLLGRDTATDLAVLKIEANEPLPYLPFGDSDGARVGDWVIAIGNPFGYGGSLSAGVVSARGRDLRGVYDDFIQTDVAINSGNSGGPLFNMDGEVIGVNTMIITNTGASVGISMSIPSNIVSHIVSQLQTYGETRRGWLGVNVRPVTAQIAAAADLSSPRGAVISVVERGGPGADAGLRVNDIVLSFDGREVRNSQIFPRIVAETAIDETVDVEILRGTNSMTLRVTVGELVQVEDEALTRLSPGTEAPELTGSVVYGMTLETLNPALRRRFNVHPDADGMLITAVEEDSHAATQVRAGDVIEEVEFTRVRTLAEIQEIVSAANGRALRFQVNRGGQYPLYIIRP
jgi:serine protease Do